MRIVKITEDFCDIKKEDIAKFIFKSMNYSRGVEWYSMQEAYAKCAELKKYIDEGSAISFLAFDDETAVGFIWAYPYPDRWDDDRVYVSIVYVNEGFRGTSIGKQLIQNVAEEAIKMGYTKIWLHTGGKNNNAIEFYNRIGFAQERVQFVKKLKE